MFLSDVNNKLKMETNTNGPNKNGLAANGTIGNKPIKKKLTRYALLK